MKTMRVMLLVAALSLCGAAAQAKGGSSAGARKALPLSALEGKWKVSSTTWGGDAKDFAGAVYELKLRKGSATGGKGEAAQFELSVSGGGRGFVGSLDGKMPFCGQRYTGRPNSFSLYQGYPRLAFWRGKEYPCGERDRRPGSDSSDANPNIEMEYGRYMIRIDLASATAAHATLYYEAGVYAVTTEKNKPALENKLGDGMPGQPKVKCAGQLCYGGITVWTGVFELELVKVR